MNYLEIICGFLTAGISTTVLYIADAVPPDLAPTLQTGGTVGLIGGLTVALIATKRECNENRKALLESEAARLTDQKEVNRTYREDAAKAESSRASMLQELREQTRAIREK